MAGNEILHGEEEEEEGEGARSGHAVPLRVFCSDPTWKRQCKPIGMRGW